MSEPRLRLAGPSDADPCAPCPWRTANHGKPHPDDWYDRRNLDRLWSGVRTGQPMSCHPTDPTNPLSPQAQAAGYRPPTPGTAVAECRGAQIMVQRELHLLGERYRGDWSAYRRDRPRGVTPAGARTVAQRLLFGGAPLIGGMPMGRPDLNAPVGHPALPWTPLTGDAAAAVRP